YAAVPEALDRAEEGEISHQPVAVQRRDPGAALDQVGDGATEDDRHPIGGQRRHPLALVRVGGEREHGRIVDVALGQGLEPDRHTSSLRWRCPTSSTWCVCGNMSNASIDTSS